jgi:hypothetical protein
MYFSEELKNLREMKDNTGYYHAYYSGYLFDKKDIFSEFINDVYEIKKKS